MNIFYYSGVDPTNPAGLRYDGPLYQGSPGLCSPASANPLVSSTPVIAAPYGPPAGGRAMDLVVAPNTVVSLLPPQVQTTNFCASAAYRMKTPYMIWPKLFRSRDRVDRSVRCELCDMVLNSEQQARQHFNGKHHLRRMRKLKLNASASEEKCPADPKRSCKPDASGKKTRLKKRQDNRNHEEPTESMADASSNGDTGADEEQAESRDEEIAKPRCRTDTVNPLRLEEAGLSREMPVIFGSLRTTVSTEMRTNSLNLGKLSSAELAQELMSSDHFSRSNNETSYSANSCSISNQPNCDLAQRHGSTCSSLSCMATDHRSSLPQNSRMSTPNSSCHSSPVYCDGLGQSSLQFGHLMSSVSSSFQLTTSDSTTSLDNDATSTSATPFVLGSFLPLP